MKMYLVLALTIFPFSWAWGFWEKEVAPIFDKYPVKIENTFVSSVYGKCKSLKDLLIPAPYPVENIELPNSLVTSQKLNVRFMYHRWFNGKIRPSPLVIYIPGAFNSTSEEEVKSFTRRMALQGMHTIAVPNPWGEQFILSGTLRPSGDILYESKALWESIKRAYAMAKPYVTGPVRLAGVSYGSFLAGMVAAYNAREGFPIPFYDVTILSPPMRMGETLDLLDSYISVTRPYVNLGISRALSLLKDVCFATNLNGMKKNVVGQAKILAVSVGFHQELVKSAELLNEMFHLDIVPKKKDSWWGGYTEEYLTWRENLDYSRFLSDFGPEIIEMVKGPYGTLRYWVNEGKNLGQDRYRIFLAEDDFLNNPEASFDIPEHTIVVPNGGHFGYRSTAWWKEFLETAY